MKAYKTMPTILKVELVECVMMDKEVATFECSRFLIGQTLSEVLSKLDKHFGLYVGDNPHKVRKPRTPKAAALPPATDATAPEKKPKKTVIFPKEN